MPYEQLLTIIIVVTLIVICINRCVVKKSIGVRVVQFLAVSIFLPTVFFLAMADKIQGESLGTLLGAVAGYLFANIADFKNSNSKNSNSEKSSEE